VPAAFFALRIVVLLAHTRRSPWPECAVLTCQTIFVAWLCLFLGEESSQGIDFYSGNLGKLIN
jgi:hypothetical protein